MTRTPSTQSTKVARKATSRSTGKFASQAASKRERAALSTIVRKTTKNVVTRYGHALKRLERY